MKDYVKLALFGLWGVGFDIALAVGSDSDSGVISDIQSGDAVGAIHSSSPDADVTRDLGEDDTEEDDTDEDDVEEASEESGTEDQGDSQQTTAASGFTGHDDYDATDDGSADIGADVGGESGEFGRRTESAPFFSGDNVDDVYDGRAAAPPERKAVRGKKRMIAGIVVGAVGAGGGIAGTAVGVHKWRKSTEDKAAEFKSGKEIGYFEAKSQFSPTGAVAVEEKKVADQKTYELINSRGALEASLGDLRKRNERLAIDLNEIKLANGLGKALLKGHTIDVPVTANTTLIKRAILATGVAGGKIPQSLTTTIEDVATNVRVAEFAPVALKTAASRIYTSALKCVLADQMANRVPNATESDERKIALVRDAVLGHFMRIQREELHCMRTLLIQNNNTFDEKRHFGNDPYYGHEKFYTVTRVVDDQYLESLHVKNEAKNGPSQLAYKKLGQNNVAIVKGSGLFNIQKNKEASVMPTMRDLPKKNRKERNDQFERLNIGRYWDTYSENGIKGEVTGRDLHYTGPRVASSYWNAVLDWVSASCINDLKNMVMEYSNKVDKSGVEKNTATSTDVNVMKTQPIDNQQSRDATTPTNDKSTHQTPAARSPA